MIVLISDSEKTNLGSFTDLIIHQCIYKHHTFECCCTASSKCLLFTKDTGLDVQRSRDLCPGKLGHLLILLLVLLLLPVLPVWAFGLWSVWINWTHELGGLWSALALFALLWVVVDISGMPGRSGGQALLFVGDVTWIIRWCFSGLALCNRQRSVPRSRLFILTGPRSFWYPESIRFLKAPLESGSRLRSWVISLFSSPAAVLPLN